MPVFFIYFYTTILQQTCQCRAGVFQHKPPQAIRRDINRHHKQCQNTDNYQHIDLFAAHAINRDIIEQKQYVCVHRDTDRP